MCIVVWWCSYLLSQTRDNRIVPMLVSWFRFTMGSDVRGGVRFGAHTIVASRLHIRGGWTLAVPGDPRMVFIANSATLIVYCNVFASLICFAGTLIALTIYMLRLRMWCVTWQTG